MGNRDSRCNVTLAQNCKLFAYGDHNCNWQGPQDVTINYRTFPQESYCHLWVNIFLEYAFCPCIKHFPWKFLIFHKLWKILFVFHFSCLLPAPTNFENSCNYMSFVSNVLLNAKSQVSEKSAPLVTNFWL